MKKSLKFNAIQCASELDHSLIKLYGFWCCAYGAGAGFFLHFWATVCKTVRPMLSDHCLSVCPSVRPSIRLSVMLVYCGQMVGWIKMKLRAQVGLGPGHIVLDGDPAPPPPKGHCPHPNFRPISVVAKRLDGSRCHLVWR